MGVDAKKVVEETLFFALNELGLVVLAAIALQDSHNPF